MAVNEEAVYVKQDIVDFYLYFLYNIAWVKDRPNNSNRSARNTRSSKQ